jgi:hypothetical protein
MNHEVFERAFHECRDDSEKAAFVIRMLKDIERIKHYLDDYESQVKAESARHESEEKKLRLLLQ